MTDQPDPVETLAEYVAISGFECRLESLSQDNQERCRREARALIAQIGPALVAEAVAQERKRAEKLHRRAQQIEGPLHARIAELEGRLTHAQEALRRTAGLGSNYCAALSRIRWQVKTSLDHPVCAVVHEVADAAIRARSKT